MKPVLKWAGGKNKLASQIINIFGEKKIYNYYELFAGGLAVLIKYMPEKALVNDLNEDLINMYKVIKESPNILIRKLRILNKVYNQKGKDFYYNIRSVDRNKNYKKLSSSFKAARFIFLNKTCFNGLYRVNSKGYFNTPFGYYERPKILDKKNILILSKYFKDNEIKFICEDYKKTLKYIQNNSLVYLDPPYFFENKKGFVGYTKKGFDYNETLRLRKFCDKLVDKNCKVVISNDDNNVIRQIFKPNKRVDYTIFEINSLTSVGSKANSRKKVKELLIYGRKKDTISSS
jgi:DNA adenine methylase